MQAPMTQQCVHRLRVQLGLKLQLLRSKDGKGRLPHRDPGPFRRYLVILIARFSQGNVRRD